MPATVSRNENIIMIPGASSDKNARRKGNAMMKIANTAAIIFLFMVSKFFRTNR